MTTYAFPQAIEKETSINKTGGDALTPVYTTDRSPAYTAEQLEALDKQRIPYHVAFIPDGNRRWAKNQKSPAIKGHRQGADTLMEIVRAGQEIGIKVTSFYVFSTENWMRSPGEVAALLWLLESYLLEKQQLMVESGIKMQPIGDLSKLPKSLCNVIQSTQEITAGCQKMEMILALNYGGRDEIRRVIHAMVDDIANKNLTKDEITETTISRYLDTAKWQDPDLLIRTSGELRLSNFLLWQTAYTEVYAENVLWPDFTPQHLLKAVLNFQKRERRLGGA